MATVGELEDIKDAGERAREAHLSAVRAEEFASKARVVRDAAIRELRAQGLSLGQVAAKAGVSRGLVQWVTRGAAQ